jgi:hypothetical protein
VINCVQIAYNFNLRRFIPASASTFMGEWAAGEFMEGEWILKDGSTYKGNFKAGLTRQSQAICRKPDCIEGTSRLVLFSAQLLQGTAPEHHT